MYGGEFVRRMTEEPSEMSRDQWARRSVDSRTEASLDEGVEKEILSKC